MKPQNLQERREIIIDTQDLENNFQLNLEKPQTSDLILDERNKERQFQSGLKKPTLFDRLSILGLVLLGGVIVKALD